MATRLLLSGPGAKEETAGVTVQFLEDHICDDEELVLSGKIDQIKAVFASRREMRINKLAFLKALKVCPPRVRLLPPPSRALSCVAASL